MSYFLGPSSRHGELVSLSEFEESCGKCTVQPHIHDNTKPTSNILMVIVFLLIALLLMIVVVFAFSTNKLLASFHNVTKSRVNTNDFKPIKNSTLQIKNANAKDALQIQNVAPKPGEVSAPRTNNKNALSKTINDVKKVANTSKNKNQSLGIDATITNKVGVNTTANKDKGHVALIDVVGTLQFHKYARVVNGFVNWFDMVSVATGDVLTKLQSIEVKTLSTLNSLFDDVAHSKLLKGVFQNATVLGSMSMTLPNSEGMVVQKIRSFWASQKQRTFSYAEKGTEFMYTLLVPYGTVKPSVGKGDAFDSALLSFVCLWQVRYVVGMHAAKVKLLIVKFDMSQELQPSLRNINLFRIDDVQSSVQDFMKSIENEAEFSWDVPIETYISSLKSAA